MCVIAMVGCANRRVMPKCYWLATEAEQHYGGILFGNRIQGQRQRFSETIRRAIALNVLF
jgi:hypothetical protein